MVNVLTMMVAAKSAVILTNQDRANMSLFIKLSSNLKLWTCHKCNKKTEVTGGTSCNKCGKWVCNSHKASGGVCKGGC